MRGFGLGDVALKELTHPNPSIDLTTFPQHPTTHRPQTKQQDQVKEALTSIASGAIALPPIAADGTTVMDTLCGFVAVVVEAKGAKQHGTHHGNLRRAA